MEPTGTYLDDLPESSRAAASPAPPPPPEEQTGTYLDDLPRDRWSPQQRLSHTLLKHARAWSPWEKVSQDLQQLGVDPEQHRESFQKLIPALRLDEARDRLSDQQETTSSLLSRHSPLPGHSVTLSFNATREYAAAKKRLEEGTPQPEDYQTIAGYERVQELDRSRPMWGKIGLQALKVPAMVGEFIGGGTILNRAGAGVMAAGRMAGLLAPAAPAAAGATVAIPKLLSTAGLTELGKGVGMAAATAPLVPSAWVEHWMRGNMEQGRDPADLAGLPAALALGMLQVSVLGAIGKIAGAVPGSGVGPWLNRIVRSVNTGAAGSQAADTAARVVGLSKEYGVLEDLWTGKWGEGGEKLATNMATFAVMGAITAHKGPKAGGEPKPGEQGGQPGPEGPEGPPRLGRPALFPGTPEILKAGAEYLSAQLRRGRSKADIVKEANDAHDRLAAALEKNPNMTREQVRSLYEDVPPGRLKDLLHTIADAFPADPVPEPPQQGLPQRPQQGPQATPEPPQAPAPAQEPPRSPEAQQAAPEPAAPQQTPQARADALEQAHLKMLQQYQAALRSEAAVKDLVAKGFPKKAELAEARRKRVEAQKALKDIKTELEGVRDEIHSQPAPEQPAVGQPAEASPQAPAPEQSQAPETVGQSLRDAARRMGLLEPEPTGPPPTRVLSGEGPQQLTPPPSPLREQRGEIVNEWVQALDELGDAKRDVSKGREKRLKDARKNLADVERRKNEFDARVLGDQNAAAQERAEWQPEQPREPATEQMPLRHKTRGELQGRADFLSRTARELRAKIHEMHRLEAQAAELVGKEAPKRNTNANHELKRVLKQLQEYQDEIQSRAPEQPTTRTFTEPPAASAPQNEVQGPEPWIDRPAQPAPEKSKGMTPAAGKTNKRKARLDKIRKRANDEGVLDSFIDKAQTGAVSLEEIFDKAKLTPQERHVARQRIEGRTYPEIGHDEPMMYKGKPVSRQRVKQIEEDLIAKMGLPNDFSLNALKEWANASNAVELAEKGEVVDLKDMRLSPGEIRDRAQSRRSHLDTIEDAIDKLNNEMMEKEKNGRFTAEQNREYLEGVRGIEAGETAGPEEEGEPGQFPEESASGRKPGEPEAVRHAGGQELPGSAEATLPASAEQGAQGPAAENTGSKTPPAGPEAPSNELKPRGKNKGLKNPPGEMRLYAGLPIADFLGQIAEFTQAIMTEVGVGIEYLKDYPPFRRRMRNLLFSEEGRKDAEIVWERIKNTTESLGNIEIEAPGSFGKLDQVIQFLTRSPMAREAIRNLLGSEGGRLPVEEVRDSVVRLFKEKTEPTKSGAAKQVLAAQMQQGDLPERTANYHREQFMETLKSMGVENPYYSDIGKSITLRTMAIDNPYEFDRKMVLAVAYLHGAIGTETNGPLRAVLAEKQNELRQLASDVSDYRVRVEARIRAMEEENLPVFKEESEEPTTGYESPYEPEAKTAEPAGKPAHFGSRGARKKNIGFALDRLARGGDEKAAVKAVIENGGVSEATARRYVREALKRAREQAQKFIAQGAAAAQDEAAVQKAAAAQEIAQGARVAAQESGLQKFLTEEEGAWNITRTMDVAKELWEKVKKAVPYLSDAYKNFAGEIAPRTMRLSPRAGNALAHAHAAPGFVHMATPYLMDRVLGPRAAPEDAVLIGAMMTERRLQYMRQAYLRAGDQNAANAVGSIIGQPYSPFQTLKDYQNLRYSQKGMDAIAAWKEHVVPEMDFYFKMSRGIDPNDPIPNMTQIPGEPINLKHVQEGQARTPSMVKSGAKNLRIQNNRFAQQATGTGDYDLDLGQIIENSLRNNVMPGVKAELFRTLASEGIGQWGTPGRSNILVQGEKSVEIPFTNPPRGTQAAGVGETSFYIHPNAYNEVMDYLNVDRSPGAMMQGTKAAMDLVTRIAMASSTEAVYHMQNMLTLLMKPGVSPFKLINNVVGLARKNPELQKRLVELSRMGATRDYGSELEKTEAGKGGVLWGGKTDPTYHVSRGLHLMDQAMRLTMEDAYESFKDAGIAEASEENKRNFINQLGQYIKTAQPWIVRFLRDTGIGPFATAGTNFWVQGLRQLTLNPGLKATSPLAAINLRLRMLGRALAAMSIPAILNFLRWGRVDGDENTPWGAIKLSRDAYGKTKYVDFLAATGITRGLRETGFLAFVQSRQSGATMGEAAARGGEDVAHGLIHPAAGPGVQAGTIAVTGKNTQGWQVAKKDENKKSDVGNNFLAAFMNMNPTIATVFGWDRANEKLSSERFYRLMGRYAPKEAKHPR